MKKLISIVLVLLVLVGCGGNNQPQEDENVLVVGMECASEPFNWTDVDGASSGSVVIAKGEGAGEYCNGLDVQVAKYVANKLGKQLQVYALDWDSLLPALDSGAIDCVIGNMSPREDRKVNYDFTSSYYDVNYVVLIRKDSILVNAKNVADLANSTIAIQTDLHEDLAKQIEGVKYTFYDNFDMEATAVKSNSIMGAIMDEPAAIAYTYKDSDFTYIPLKNNDNGFKVAEADYANAAAFKKGNALRDEVEEIISSISMDTYYQLMEEVLKVNNGETVDKFCIE